MWMVGSVSVLCQLFRDEDRLLDDDVPRLLPDRPDDRDTPEDRFEDPELRTADEPDDRPEDDRPTEDDREDLLPAASRSTEDAALVAPRRRILPNELEEDLADSRLSRVAERKGDSTGRKYSVFIRDVRCLDSALSSVLCLVADDSSDLSDDRSVL